MAASNPAAPAKLMTVDEFWDFCQLPENAEKRHILLDGRVVEVSRPRHPHGRLTMTLGRFLDDYGDEVGSGYSVTESGVLLSESPARVLGPDLGFFEGSGDFHELHPKWPDVPPILVAEVSSPNDKMQEFNRKISAYQRSGIRLIWVLSSEEPSVTVYRTGSPLEVLDADSELSGWDVLPGFRCRVADIYFPRARRNRATS